MDSKDNPTRRSILKRIGVSSAAVSAAGVASANSDQEGDPDDGKRIYKADGAEVIKFSDQKYSVRGRVPPERHKNLVRRFVWSTSDKVEKGK